jgi:AraC family transcriptional regulator of adaptative response/methylated-DNA-[protein]-cysteine methyltransferase
MYFSLPRDTHEPELVKVITSTCSLGIILVASTAKGVCAIFLGDDAEILSQELQTKLPYQKIIHDASDQTVIAKVINFIESPTMSLDLVLDTQGTPFQKMVWDALQQIPLGQTASYTQIAQKIGLPKAARAVARACGANMVSLAIPCHRVIGNNGVLTGYRWGIERKQILLQREAK